jgi:precorrin-6B methylase 2
MSPSYTLAFSASELRRYKTMAVDAVRQEQEAWRAAGMVPGARVADIGCGPGTILVELARLVSPGGIVDGVERDPVAQAAAAQVIADAGVTNARLVAGAADASGLEPGSYEPMVLVSDKLRSDIGILQTKFSHREGHEARRGRL